MSLSALDREMFSEAEAARLLRVAQSTLHYWLEGGERRDRTYQQRSDSSSTKPRRRRGSTLSTASSPRSAGSSS
jgi:hypothetical protein